MYKQSSGKDSPGWVKGEDDVLRATKAFVDRTLESECFDSVTKDGKPYAIHGATRLGLVPHRDSLVTVFCLDLDDHTGDGGHAHLRDSFSRFFGVTTLYFSSKGGKGLHGFFKLKEPMPTRDFVGWLKLWGFNRSGEPEVFPKTEKLTQVWLPGEPNELGGDRYISGEFESCVINELPEAPPVQLTSTTLRFLRGQASEPGRNEALNKVAFELGNKRIDRGQAWELCERASRLCGLEPFETKTTFDSGYQAGLQDGQRLPNQATVDGSANHYSLNGIGNGERFVSMHAQDARYCFALKEWYVWDTTRWSVRPDRVAEMAKLSARSIEDGGHRKKTSSKRGVDEILFMACSEPGMSIDLGKIDGDPMLFNCMNGTINLKTGTLGKHARSDMLTKISPASFDPKAGCPRWTLFLEQIFGGDAELISYIQQVSGYMMTGLTTEHCLFFMHGLGQNGKSVLASALIHVFGDYGQRAPAELIMKADRSSPGSASPDLARLRGARLVVTSELEEQQRFGEARIKDLTGGDRIVARGLYKDPVEFDPTHKLFLYGNHKPTISGTDAGIWRRMRLIPFEVSIPESERDLDLLDVLKGERDGILAWMVEGCLLWQRDRLSTPSVVAKATQDFRGQSDHVGRFIGECCEQADGVFVAKGELYTAYQRWCGREGEEPLAKNTFSTRISQRGINSKSTKSCRMWIGIELREGEGADHG